jgi:hypothetical protein
MPDDTRPTFGQALDSADAASSAGADSSAAPTSSDSSPSSAPPAAAATQPGAEGGVTTPPATEVPQEWTPEQGPLPFDRHKAILEHTRSKAKEDAEQAVREQYGWALEVGPENFQTLTNLASQWASDPIAFVLGALDDLQAHPHYAPQLRSHVAKILAQRPQQPTAQEIPEPQPDITVDGTSWYSAARLAERDKWFQNRLLSQVRAELQPIREDLTERQQRDQIQYATQEAARFAADTLSQMTKLPHFTEQKAEIEKVFRAMPPMPDHLVGQAIRDAYIQVLTSKVLPHLSSQAKSELLSSLNTKAAASASHPTTQTPPVNGRPTSFEEALRQADAQTRAL